MPFIRFKKCLILTVTLFSAIQLKSQNIFSGKIQDSNEGFALPYAQIKIDCLPDMLFSDELGGFSVVVPNDSCWVEFNFIGYQSIKRQIIFSNKNRNLNLSIKMVQIAIMLDAAEISASKYETNHEKSTSSILILKPKSVENRNLTTIDGLLNTATGVAVVDNEPQIRGGSGFSSGMGSRVLILLDDMPLLRPDAGRPMWTFIPMENVEQVDVIKGASSVIFGSSAITGAINVHTAYPRIKPKTKVTLYAGMYGDPNLTKDKPYLKSWKGHAPLNAGFSFLHSRIIKKNFDFIIGGEAFCDQGYIGPEEKVTTTQDSSKKSSTGIYEKRIRLNFATRYRFNKVKGFNICVNGNFMYSDNAQSFFWYDAYENRYRTYKGSLSMFKDLTFYVDPVINYNSKKGFNHSFRNRILYSNNKEASGTQNATSLSIFDEYQFTKNINSIGMKIISGLINNYSVSDGVVFNGEKSSNESKQMFSNNLALYAQLEQKFLKRRNLTVEAGFRWEFYKLNNEKIEQKPIFRTGINYQIPKLLTSIRASWGQGYRFPSIGEKYIAISVGRYGFYPNSNLKSETSWNTELGVVQPFKIFDFKGMFDAALFYQSYDNYIEFAMGLWGHESHNPMDNMGFRYLNTGKATIKGIDLTVMGEGEITRNVKYTLSLGYTFSYPTSDKPNEVYYYDSAVNRTFSFNETSYDTTRNVLKYRIEHMFKADLEFLFYKKWALGFTINYYSAMKNVDKFFFVYDIDNPNIGDDQRNINRSYGDLPFKGYYNYFNDNIKGSWVFDTRISYAFSNLTMAFVVKNIFNNSYALRPMLSEQPRSYTLQLTYNIN